MPEVVVHLGAGGEILGGSSGGADGDGGSSTTWNSAWTIRKIWNIWIWKSRWWFLLSPVVMDIEAGGGGGAGGTGYPGS